jgi:hypothetical protein
MPDWNRVDLLGTTAVLEVSKMRAVTICGAEEIRPSDKSAAKHRRCARKPSIMLERISGPWPHHVC